MPVYLFISADFLGNPTRIKILQHGLVIYYVNYFDIVGIMKNSFFDFFLISHFYKDSRTFVGCFSYSTGLNSFCHILLTSCDAKPHIRKTRNEQFRFLCFFICSPSAWFSPAWCWCPRAGSGQIYRVDNPCLTLSIAF